MAADSLKSRLYRKLQRCSYLYLTLSHLGGSDKSTSLTTANTQDYENQIVLCELSTLFQLAIRAAETLKLQYLCIEDLCVLQDSKEDVATGNLDKGTGPSGQSFDSTAMLALLHDQGLGCSSEAYTAVPAQPAVLG